MTAITEVAAFREALQRGETVQKRKENGKGWQTCFATETWSDNAIRSLLSRYEYRIAPAKAPALSDAQRQAKRRAQGSAIALVLNSSLDIRTWDALVAEHGGPLPAFRALLAMAATARVSRLERIGKDIEPPPGWGG